MSGQLIEVPTSPALSHYWGFGSILGTYLGNQLLSGFLIATVYLAATQSAYLTVITLVQEGWLGWMLYIAHSVGAGFVLALTYLHVSKWIHLRTQSWLAQQSGVVILLMLIVSSFLGYVLLWQQMSYWAATVITSLVSIAPYGSTLLFDLWGSFTIDGSTLTRFYALHFLLTLVVAALAVIHLLLLHAIGSSSSSHLLYSPEALSFGRYYLVKDIILFVHAASQSTTWSYSQPSIFADTELFLGVNTMATPPHIVPEWYLLLYYAVLRGVPNKTMGTLMVAVLLGESSFSSVMPAKQD